MKQYLAFTGPNQYPKGAMQGFVGDFDSVNEAKAGIDEFRETNDDIQNKSLNSGWAEIFDTQTDTIAWQHPQ